MKVTPPRPPEAGTVAPRGAELNRKFFFFFDLQTADTQGKVKAEKAAVSFLETQTRPGDEAAVLGFFAMSGVFIRQYLTTDMAQVRRAIKGAVEAAPSPGECLEISDDKDDEQATPSEQDAPTATTIQGIFVPGTSIFARRDFAARMKDLAETFKTIPGPKSLILFSSRNLGRAWEYLGRMFGETGTAVFAVNTQDWKTSFFGTKVPHVWHDHSLKSVAEASGGKYFADITDHEANVRGIQDLAGNFYVLGYYIKESWEGKYHKIRVEVARPGAQVLVQDGYADPKPFGEMTEFEKDIQLIDLLWAERPVSNPLGFPVEALDMRGGGRPGVCILAEFSVGARSKVPPSEVEVFALIRDETGSPVLSRKWDIDLAPYEGQALCPYLAAEVKAGSYDLRMVVRDKGTGESLIGRSRFVLAAGPVEGILLSSPLLVETGKGVFLKLASPPGKKEGASDLRLIDIYHLIPRDSRPLIGEIPARTTRLWAVLPFQMRPVRPQDEPPALSIKAVLISRETAEEDAIEVRLRDQKKLEAGREIAVLEMALPPLAPGEYDLEFTVSDIASGRRGAVRKTLTVRQAS